MKAQKSRRFSARLWLRILTAVLSVLLLCLSALQPFSVAAANLVPIPTEASIWAQLKTIYSQALAFDKARYGLTQKYGYTAFVNLCAHYVHIQLMLLGVNTTYVRGNGNDEYDNYKNLAYSSGGKKIHAYPDTKWSIYDALVDISKQSRVATNILLGIQTAYSSSAGRSMGHVCLIHAVIDGYVYYTDNFALNMAGRHYEQGEPIKCTISEFSTYYSRTTLFDYEGIIWFEDEKITEAVGKGYDYYEPTAPGQESSSDPSVTYEPGQYTVIYGGGMNIRQNPTTASLSLGIVPYNSTVSVTAVQGNWGNVFCTVNGVDLNGWMCLDKQYATRVAGLNMIAAELYDSAGKLVSRQWFNTLKEAAEQSASGTTLILYSDVSLPSDVTLGNGIKLKTSGHNVNTSGGALLVRGGSVESEKEIALLKNDPFVKSAKKSGVYTYSVAYSLTIKKASLDITDGVAMQYTAVSDLPASLTGLSYSLKTDGFPGSDKKTYSGTSAAGGITFRTDIIPAEQYNDIFNAIACAQKTVNGVTYTLESAPLMLSPAGYAGLAYGKDAKLNRVLAAMMNFSSAAQALNGTDEDNFSNRILPESARNLTYDNSVLCSAVGAPAGTSNLSVHINHMELKTDGAFGLRFSSDSKLNSTVKLLVFSAETYADLKKKAGSGDVASLMTEKNATAVLTADKNGVFTLDNIPVAKYADTWFFRLCDTANGNCDNVFSASVTDYCAALLQKTTDMDIQTYCRAICEYSAAVRTYFNYSINGGKIK